MVVDVNTYSMREIKSIQKNKNKNKKRKTRAKKQKTKQKKIKQKHFFITTHFTYLKDLKNPHSKAIQTFIFNVKSTLIS